MLFKLGLEGTGAASAHLTLVVDTPIIRVHNATSPAFRFHVDITVRPFV
jgi:hypothetical protein